MRVMASQHDDARRRFYREKAMSADKNSAHEEAAAWFVRLESDAATEKDWLDFERWMAAPSNKAAYESVEQAMQSVEGQHAALAAALEQRPAAPRRAISASVWISVASGAAILLAAV